MSQQEQFDRWAGDYDKSISQSSQGYPFEGYYEVLGFVHSLIQEPKNAVILDLGVGTGLLTHELYKHDAKIIGVDFSEGMLEKAREKMPRATFYCYDFSQGLPVEFGEMKFDYIVSSYAFHHLPDPDKVKLLRQLNNHLSEMGWVFIADVAFATVVERDMCRLQAGGEFDEEEYYIVAEEFLPLLDGIGQEAKFVKISPCAGVLQFQKG